MATRKKPYDQDPSARTTPTQQDEADIVEEVGAEHDEESGELVADEARVLKAGAIDAESVIENRRIRKMVNDKREKKKGVTFNAEDILTKYDMLVRTWGVTSTLEIQITRLTGTPTHHVIMSRPRSGAELYNELMLRHGQNEEAQYDIKIVDHKTREYRGKGRITLPDTRPQQGQPMNYPPPYGYPPAPGYPQGYPPAQGYPPGYPTQQQPPVPQQPQPTPGPGAPQPPPQVFVQPPAGPDPMAMFQQMFEMVKQVMQQQQSAAPQPQQPQFMPPAPTSPDPAAMMQWFQQMFEMVRQAQPPQTSSAPTRGVQSPNPAQVGPTTPPPAGMMWGWLPGFGFALVPERGISEPQPRGRPYYPPPGERRPYYGDRDREPQPGPSQPPQREKTMAEQYRDALALVRTAQNVVNEFSGLAPSAGISVAEEGDDNPVIIQDPGHGLPKMVRNKDDGAIRWGETGLLLVPDFLKWVSEQREAIQKAHAEQRRQQPPPAVLPPGYVEVGPDYKPPPGYVAVPVDPRLQPIPADIPPPIQPPGAAPPPAWGAPPMPERSE